MCPWTADSLRPGYTIPAEFVPTLFHQRGALAAAREGDVVNPKRASSGSQFYIVQGRKFSESDFPALEKKILDYSGNRYSIPEEHRKVYSAVGGAPHLDSHYTVFGQVIAGFDVIDKIADVEVDPSKNHRPLEDVKMKVKIKYLTVEQIDKLKD